MSFIAGLRLPITAFSVAAVQASLVDQADLALLDHLDLPLAVVIALATARPGSAVVAGFLFGLAVDAFHTRLFGLHGLAYALLGPLAAVLPVSGLRTRSEVLCFLVAGQAVFATTVVMVGSWFADGQVEWWSAGRYLQIVTWAVVIAAPLSAALGGRPAPVIGDGVATHPGAGTAEWVR